MPAGRKIRQFAGATLAIDFSPDPEQTYMFVVNQNNWQIDILDRKAGITRGDFKRKSPHHVALPAKKMRDLVNRQVIFCAAGVLSATPLTYSLLPTGSPR
jgi:hypothetical protein